ncbi:hypothetical protein [Streptomyces sp. NPDC051452]|uniref:hypothetical protein n=1 Tax=Streptomyces sp. NPDC051452 TaxID=3365654 RepID=UPI0037962B11
MDRVLSGVVLHGASHICGVLLTCLLILLAEGRVHGFGGWCVPELDQVALSVIADAGFGIVGVAVQTHADPVAAVGRGWSHLQGRFLFGPGVPEVALPDGGEVEGVGIGQQAQFLRRFPDGFGFRAGRAVVYLDGHLQRAGVGGGKDNGERLGGGSTAPAVGHGLGEVVVVVEANEVTVFADVDGERHFAQQHASLLQAPQVPRFPGHSGGAGHPAGAGECSRA